MQPSHTGDPSPAGRQPLSGLALWTTIISLLIGFGGLTTGAATYILSRDVAKDSFDAARYKARKEDYATAVVNLRSAMLNDRMDAIDVMASIMEDFPNAFQPMILRRLTNLVRCRTPRFGTQPSRDCEPAGLNPHEPHQTPATDVQAALTLIGSRDPQYDKGERVDLSNTDLRWACLLGARLGGANMTGADLTNANIQCADFDHATGLDLSGAIKPPCGPQGNGQIFTCR